MNARGRKHAINAGGRGHPETCTVLFCRKNHAVYCAAKHAAFKGVRPRRKGEISIAEG